jgi:hypothetical protein
MLPHLNQENLRREGGIGPSPAASSDGNLGNSIYQMNW